MVESTTSARLRIGVVLELGGGGRVGERGGRCVDLDLATGLVHFEDGRVDSEPRNSSGNEVQNLLVVIGKLGPDAVNEQCTSGSGWIDSRLSE